MTTALPDALPIYQGGHNHDRSPDTEQARHHTSHQANESHEHPRHPWSPRSGLPPVPAPAPQPPPPGASCPIHPPAARATLTTHTNRHTNLSEHYAHPSPVP